MQSTPNLHSAVLLRSTNWKVQCDDYSRVLEFTFVKCGEVLQLKFQIKKVLVSLNIEVRPRMQQTGTLKKRRKRNLNKVRQKLQFFFAKKFLENKQYSLMKYNSQINGLSIVTYDESGDWFDGQNIFTVGPPTSHASKLQKSYNVQGKSFGIAMRMNTQYVMEFSRRVTRDPRFHEPLDETVTHRSDMVNHVELGPEGLYSTSRKSATERTHFLNATTMTRLRQLIILGASSGAFPWRWNGKEHRIDKWAATKERLWWAQWCIAAADMIFLLLFNTYIFVKTFSENETFREAFMSSYSVTWYMCVIAYMVNQYFHMDQTREFVNTLLQFNKEYVDKYLIHLDGYDDGGWGVLNISIPCGIFEVVMGVVMFFAMPELPFYLISYVHPTPWYYLIPGAFHQYMVYGQTIAWYNLTWWIMLAHTSSANFWLGETQ